MDSRKKFAFALVSGIVILSVSVLVAFICFSLLDSSAQANIRDWKLGGAFAGFVFTASMFTSIVFQFYRQMTSDQIEDYRALIQELQTKLIKGAPCPEDFTIDIDERHKLVFARPTQWIPRAGLLYQYVNKTKTGNIPANFNVSYLSDQDLKDFYHLDPHAGPVDLGVLYKNVIDSQVDGLKQSLPGFQERDLMQEYTSIDGIKSVKYIHKYAYTQTNAGQPGEKVIDICQAGLFSYIPRSKGLFIFTFSDDESEYLKSSEIFNSVISSIRFL